MATNDVPTLVQLRSGHKSEELLLGSAIGSGAPLLRPRLRLKQADVAADKYGGPPADSTPGLCSSARRLPSLLIDREDGDGLTAENSIPARRKSLNSNRLGSPHYDGNLDSDLNYPRPTKRYAAIMSSAPPVALNDAPVVKRRSRRRRLLLNRMGRASSSSPQLAELGAEYAARNSVSCISLRVAGASSAGSTAAVRVAGKDVVVRNAMTTTAAVPRTVTVHAMAPRIVNRNFLEALPGEICLQVLSYLEPKELVNKTLGRLCFDGQLWSVLDTGTFYKEIPAHQLTRLIGLSGPFIRYLNLRGCVQLQNEFHAITKTCNNLVSASLEGCSLSRPTVHRLITNNHSLVQLNLSGLEAVSNFTCKHIADSCPLLTTLDVSFCTNMDARGVRKIVEACTRLTDLRAAECLGINDEGTLEAIFRANTLERLLLSGCDSLTDESIRILVEGIEADIDPLTDRTTAPARRLRHLNVSKCRGLTDLALRHLAHNVPELEGLELAHVAELTDEGLTDLLPTVPKLSHLDLEECGNVTNDALVELAKAPCAGVLRHLQLSFCESVSDEGMVPVVKACTALRNIELDNTRITDTFLVEAAAAVRQRGSAVRSRKPRIGLRLVCFDCVNVNWTGIHAVLAANSTRSLDKKLTDGSKDGVSSSIGICREVIQLKCYYGWQQTADQHLKLVMRGDCASAKWLEERWSEHMTSNEDSSQSSRRRRRRAREAALLDLDENHDGRRRRRTGGCAIM
ncbi:hypothetical protein Dda_6451 [Drechslerella dactyloides]|uniref:F-box domain-containing protein n=1 Tax=Drechslerella dactyloides TaxID=74499 RepID=A0AAD6IU09_DREDA|nr:hypothetical protein Dda_6451 [Drechslerella dactyloides]